MVSSKSSPIIPLSAQSIYIDGKKYPLSEQVVKNIEKIIGFQAKQEQKLPMRGLPKAGATRSHYRKNCLFFW